MQSTKLAVIGVLGLASLGLGSLAAQAAPPAPGALETLNSAGRDGKAETVAYRRCWWQYGQRHCRRYGSDYRGYGYRGYYGPLYPEAYRTGSSRWWQEMDREDRGGRGSRR